MTKKYFLNGVWHDFVGGYLHAWEQTKKKVKKDMPTVKNTLDDVVAGATPTTPPTFDPWSVGNKPISPAAQKQIDEYQQIVTKYYTIDWDKLDPKTPPPKPAKAIPTATHIQPHVDHVDEPNFDEAPIQPIKIGKENKHTLQKDVKDFLDLLEKEGIEAPTIIQRCLNYLKQTSENGEWGAGYNAGWNDAKFDSDKND